MESGDALQQPLVAPAQCLEDGPADGGLPLAEPLPCRRQPCKHPAGMQYYQLYLRMLAWLAVLFCGWGVQRACCQLGLPSDGLRQMDFFEVFSDASTIMLYGAVLGWFAGVTCPRRFAWLFSRQRWYVWATLAGTPPVYSAISNVAALKRDLTDLGAWGLPFILLWSAGMAAILGTIGWHVAAVARRRAAPDAAAYVAARALLLAWFGGSAVVLKRQGIDMHIHHLYQGFAFALWAELDEPLSGVALAVGAGIMVQGIGSYSMQPIFQERCFTSPSAPQLECAFDADSPFSVQICSATGPVPRHSCHT